MNNLDPYHFYFELPIYTIIKIDEANSADLYALLQSRDTLDAYNPTLKEKSTFSVGPCCNNGIAHYWKYGGVNYSRLRCLRTDEEYYFYYYYNQEEGLFQKIGQYPSIADFHISQIKKYDKVLSKEKLKEFTRAIGLAANGVGIGSFVYLRRIFEDLIVEAYQKAKQVNGWDDELFGKSRMAEKIELLKDFLPDFLVENKNLYGILSVGIHSLKEEDCLAYFETVKVGIEFILDEKVEKYQKEKKMEEAKARLAALNQKLK